MSEFTTTGYEKRIRVYADENGHDISKSKVQRLAMRLAKRQVRMTDLDLERILTHSDPTPKKAFQNLKDAKHALMEGVAA